MRILGHEGVEFTKFWNPLMPTGEYVYACPTEGQCWRLHLAQYGWKSEEELRHDERVNPYRERYSLRRAIKVIDGVPYGAEYKICMHRKCGKPINAGEASSINAFLGNKLPKVEISDEIMEILNGL